MEEYLTEQELRLVNPQIIQDMIQKEIPISVTVYHLTPEMKHYLQKIVATVLHQMRQDATIDYIVYCLSELIDNSQRANAKRIYFHEQNLDIFNPQDYHNGMETFKTDFIANQSRYQSYQEERGLSVTMTLLVKDESLYLEVANSTKLTVFEYKRIHDRIARALDSQNPAQIFSHINEQEGAGLGLISITLMLQKFGISEDNIQIISQEDSTAIKIKLPQNMDEYQYISAISKEIAESLQNIPQLPENISKISRLLDDPTSQMGEIIDLIQQDVTLSADLLKLVNSASFRAKKTPTNIEDSVKMVGLRGIRNMIYAIGSLQNLTPVTKTKKALWSHAHVVASYSLALAYKFYSTNKKIVSDAYVCGLLHDIGKILFEAAHPETLQNLLDFCHTKHIPPRVYEKIIGGANHGEIGALITTKWNFPEVITAAIEFHHTPHAAPECHRKLVEIVYLANIFCHYQNQSIPFRHIDPTILSSFGITEEKQFQQLIKEIDML
ncbi:MAG: HDOD domain-containing protein [Spirochaetaceae bacterium]|nr:HDOD domain-containing protein [Spirochaetaceae bacterium]